MAQKTTAKQAKTPANATIKIVPKKMVLKVWYEGRKMKSRMMEDVAT